MQIIGDKLIPFEEMIFVSKTDLSANKNPKSHIVFNYDEANIEVALKLGLKFSLFIKDEIEAIKANAMDVKFIILDLKSAKFCEKIISLCEYYLFDTKTACIVKNEGDIKRAIKLKFDAVIYQNAIKNLNV